MKTIKLKVGHLSTLEEVEHINEELQALLIPLLTAVENEADTEWQVQRSMVNSYFRLSEFPEIKHIQIPTLAELETMPIGEAQNLISSLEADSYQGHGRRGSYAMNLRRKEKKALKPMVMAIEQASQLHIQDMGGYRS
ncbi:hypothetical protein ACT2XF_000053 [Providencia rettgeri]